MRPRVFPAEDVRALQDSHQHDLSFNEAAGIPRGRRAVRLQEGRAANASMRPRVFPAEDDGRLERHDVQHRASMRPRVFPAEDPPASRRR